jgi:hypothetical protein
MVGINKRTNGNAERKVRLIIIVVLHRKENHKEQIVTPWNITGQKRIYLRIKKSAYRR